MKPHQPSVFPLQDYYSGIYRTYDLMNRLFTLGLDRRWRRHTIEACFEGRPENILDLCCGTGDLAIGICRSGKAGMKITGYDLNASMLDVARQKAAGCGEALPEFIQGDVASMPFENGTFDCITIGFGFRNLIFENPAQERHISEISRVMRPGARLLILESALPDNRLIALLYRMYLWMFMVPLGGILSGNWRAYRYLARSSARFYNFSAIAGMLQGSNLKMERRRKFLFGSVNLLVATRYTDS